MDNVYPKIAKSKAMLNVGYDFRFRFLFLLSAHSHTSENRKFELDGQRRGRGETNFSSIRGFTSAVCEDGFCSSTLAKLLGHEQNLSGLHSLLGLAHFSENKIMEVGHRFPHSGRFVTHTALKLADQKPIYLL